MSERFIVHLLSFSKRKRNDMKMLNGQMDGWMQVRTLCLSAQEKVT